MNRTVFILSTLLVVLFSGCALDFLDLKPDKSQVVPATLDDLLALMDNSATMNLSITPSQTIIVADEYYLSDDRWETLSVPEQKQGYIWSTENYYEDQWSPNWNYPYRAIFYCNLALEKLSGIPRNPANETQWLLVKGSAHFFRAWALFQLAQLYCPPYPGSGSGAMGLPLRLESDINEPSVRSSVTDTYAQIESDLRAACSALPMLPSIATRASKAATYGTLARLFLQKQDYATCAVYADSCLRLQSTLIDYNDTDIHANYPFPRFNPEVIFHSSTTAVVLTASRLQVDTTLFDSYRKGDLRKQAFFRVSGGINTFKGSYDGGSRMFCGIATDEVMLMLAECRVRNGDISAAMEVMERLLVTRYAPDAVEIPASQTETEALHFILDERKKQLVYRGTRWGDLRRLNTDVRFAATIFRKINGVEYALSPQDPRYTVPIPDDAVRYGGIPQNPY